MTAISKFTPTSSMDLQRIAEFLARQPQHELQSTTVHGARVQPMRGLSGGVLLNPEWKLLRQQKKWHPIDDFDETLQHEDYIDDEYIYGGPIGHLHFGHVMAEFVHRLVPSIQSFGSGKFLFAARYRGPNNFDQMPEWFQQILSFLGLNKHNTKIINHPTRVKRLHICQQGSCLGGDPDHSYLNLLSAFSSRRIIDLTPARIAPRKIYVSRSNLSPGGNFLGEHYIESLLEEREFHLGSRYFGCQ